MNSRGYIFPAVLVFCLIFSMLTAHQLLIYLGEKQFLTAQRQQLQLGAMIEKSSRQAISNLEKIRIRPPALSSIKALWIARFPWAILVPLK
ncbi:hypothetical protein [Fictibacillus sp. NRS-1165]|uniref:hypothetical protein n=1 Tax=Fictibacillus sp. NRS-1165 TaxID=3144463 RepID=UPI003D1FE1EA